MYGKIKPHEHDKICEDATNIGIFQCRASSDSVINVSAPPCKDVNTEMSNVSIPFFYNKKQEKEYFVQKKQARTDTVHCAQRSGYMFIPVILSVMTGDK